MNTKITLILLILLTLMACSKTKEPPPPSKLIQFNGLKEKTLDFKNLDYEGYVIGADLNRDELYIQSFSKLKKHFLLNVVDLKSQKTKKELQLKFGAHESPTDFFNPSYMQFCDGNYMIVDQHDKVLVYDKDFNYLYTDMFRMPRYFIDFYLFNSRKYLVIGAKKFGVEYHANKIKIFRFPKNGRPEFLKELHEFKNKSLILEDRANPKTQHLGNIWTAGNGFEKGGNIFFSNNDEQEIYIYNLSEDKYSTFKLEYLRAKKFSSAAAMKLEAYRDDGWAERSFKRTGIRSVAVPYPKPLYHFGLYDVGVQKIGVIGVLDTDKFRFRLDILDSSSGEYLESIWLPFGDGFIATISTGARGQHQPIIDVDKGYYCWNNAEGEELSRYVHITLFKDLEETKGSSNK